MAEEVAASPPPRKSGKRRVLLFSLVLILLTPVLTWVGIAMLSKEERKVEAKKAIKKPDKGYPELGAPSNLSLPLVTNAIEYIKGTPSLGIMPQLIPSGVQAVRDIEKMILRLADTNGVHHAVMQVFLSAQNSDALLHRFNTAQKTNPVIYLAVSNLISRKKMAETRSPGFRNVLRGEILQICNAIMGKGTVQDVVITDFVVQ